MICRWVLELMARKSTRQALSVGQFKWEHNFFLNFLLSVAPSLFCIPAGAVPAASYKQAIQQKYLPNCFICKHHEGLPVGLHCTGTLLTYSQLLAHQDPRSFLLSCFLVSQTQRAHGIILFQKQDFALALIPFSLSFNSIQSRPSVAITTCHKPHCNGAKMHLTSALVVPTLRSLSAYKRPITR